MKKLFLLAISVFTLTMVAVSCSNTANDNTPTAAVEKAINCLKEGDMAGYHAMLARKTPLNLRERPLFHTRKKAEAAPTKPKEGDKADMGLAPLLRTPAIESFTVSDEQIAENGKKATVLLTMTMKDGAKKIETVSVLNFKNEGWKLAR